MAQKQILPHNIRVDRNCQPAWVTQNAISEEQELILLRGGHYDPPPDKVGLNAVYRVDLVLLVSSLLVDTLCDQMLDCYWFIDSVCTRGLKWSTWPKFVNFSPNRWSVKIFPNIFSFVEITSTCNMYVFNESILKSFLDSIQCRVNGSKISKKGHPKADNFKTFWQNAHTMQQKNKTITVAEPNQIYS